MDKRPKPKDKSTGKKGHRELTVKDAITQTDPVIML